MRMVIALLVVLLVALQYKLWVGEGGLMEVWRLSQQIDQQETRNAELRQRNKALAAEVKDLKHGLEAVEERARSELGMIRHGETFYQVLEPDTASQ